MNERTYGYFLTVKTEETEPWTFSSCKSGGFLAHKVMLINERSGSWGPIWFALPNGFT